MNQKNNEHLLQRFSEEEISRTEEKMQQAGSRMTDEYTAFIRRNYKNANLVSARSQIASWKLPLIKNRHSDLR